MNPQLTRHSTQMKSPFVRSTSEYALRRYLTSDSTMSANSANTSRTQGHDFQVQWFSWLIVALLMFPVAPGSAPAQVFDGLATNMPQMKAVLSMLCEDTPEFSATAKIQMFGRGGAYQSGMTIGLALREDHLRQEMDVSAIPQIPPEIRAGMAVVKLDKIVILTRVDRKRVYIVFPGVQAYVEYPISDVVLSNITRRTSAVSHQKTNIGHEVVDGHSCAKNKVIVTEPNEPTGEATLWQASDLSGFPIQMEVVDASRTTKFEFKNVQVGKPEASLFEIPASYVSFTNTSDIIPYARSKALGDVRPEAK